MKYEVPEEVFRMRGQDIRPGRPLVRFDTSQVQYGETLELNYGQPWTMNKSYLTRVKRKGQVTIPSEFREELGLEEGSMIIVQKEKGGLLIRAVPPVRAGRVVGREEYDRLIAELDESRRNWRRQE